MLKQMKKSLILLIISFIGITSCVTTEKQEIVLPPEPVREELEDVHSVKEMAERIDYYDSLVQQWEAWADKVKKIIKP